MNRILGIVAILALLPSPAPAQQKEVPPKVIGLEVGLNGKFKVGQWTPLELTFLGGSQRMVGLVEVTTIDGDGTSCRFVAPQPVQVLPGQATRSPLYVRFGSSNVVVDVRYRVEGRVAAYRRIEAWLGDLGQQLTQVVPGESMFVATYGSALGMPELVEKRMGDQNHPLETTSLDRFDQLPSRWYGYEAVDTLLLATSRPELFDRFTPDSAHREALVQWIEQGGRLVMCVGAEAEAVIGPGGPLADLAPGRLAEMVELPTTQALETYSAADVRIPRVGAARNLRVPRLENVQGVVVVRQGEVPLVIRSPLGFGEIVFVAVDLDRRPFADWEGRLDLLERLLESPSGEKPASDSDTNVNQYYGSQVDLAGQLRTALDHFEGVKMVPFALVALLVLGYIALIGPVDFLLVRHLLKRMELTWVTFPLMVVLVSGGAYALSYWTKGTEVRLNQVEVVDVDTTDGLVRGTTWLNLFTPRTKSFNFTLRPDARLPQPADDAQLLFSWFGLPGSGYGGMEVGGTSPRLFARAYQIDPNLNAIDEVPIQVWSSKSFVGRWTYRTQPPAMSQLSTDDRGTLEGEVTNPLVDTPLADCLLLYGRNAYELGDIAPGATRRIDASMQQRSVQSVLKQYQHSDPNLPMQTLVAYDAYSSDVSLIVPQMMFYKATGGRDYSHLWNRYQGFIDLSDQLELNRAILLGRSDPERPAAELIDDGQPLQPAEARHWVFYRFVLPVDSEPTP